MRKPLPHDLVDREVRRITEVIAREATPLAIFLFGSAARGEATDQSDFDFLVVMDNAAQFKAARVRLAKAMPLSTFPVDLVWTTRAEFLRKRELGGVCFDAWSEGRATYCRPNEAFLNDQNKTV